MNKKILITILTILGLAIVAGGFYLWSQKKAEVMQNDAEKQIVKQDEQGIGKEENGKNGGNDERDQNNEEQNNQDDNSEELDFEKIDTSNWKTYRNEEFGFEVKLPGDLEKWNIKAKYYSKEQSKYACGEYFVNFYYKIDAKIPDVVPTPKNTTKISYLKGKEDRLFLLNIVPVECYTDKIELLNLHKPFPPIGKEIDKNSRFVFLVLPSSLTEPLCTYVDDIERQKSDFCKIENIFATALNISKLLNFRSIN